MTNTSFFRSFSWWHVSVLLLTAILALPLFTILGYLTVPSNGVWQHLVDTVLAEYVTNSLLLMTGTAIGSLLLGVSCAWLTSMCEFRGRRVFDWALLLPMAMPAYIIAYTYTGLLDAAGPVQTGLRETFALGFGDYWFPLIRSLSGAIVMLSLVLYPYVYMLARATFLEQSASILEVSRSLGHGPWQTFFRVNLPMSRPAIIAGVSLVMMESLADYGTVQYFGVSTFTTGIFRTWYGLNAPAAAAQLSALLLSFVFVLLLLEQASRRRARYYQIGSKHGELPRYRLRGAAHVGAVLLCGFVLAAGFLIPAGQLLVWALKTWEKTLDDRFVGLLWNTVTLAGSAALLSLALALVMNYGKRLHPTSWSIQTAAQLAGMGYAAPGTIIAVGVIIPLAAFDNTLDGWLRAQFNISTGLLLSGTLAALLFAYSVRFLAVALQTVDTGLGKIKPSMEESARALGESPRRILFRIHLPILRGSLLTALLLVFVDVMKELPATLILRPFNFNTLAVRAYELASDERLADASLPALAIVIAGLIPVILLSLSISRARIRKNAE